MHLESVQAGQMPQTLASKTLAAPARGVPQDSNELPVRATGSAGASGVGNKRSASVDSASDAGSLKPVTSVTVDLRGTCSMTCSDTRKKKILIFFNLLCA